MGSTSVFAGYLNFSDGDDFTFFPLPTAWDPGLNTARVGGFPAPGAASWSVMGPTLSASPGDPHSGSTTSDLTALYAGGVDEITTIGLTLDKWAAVSGFTNLGMVADSGVDIGAPEASGGHLGDIRVGAIFIDGTVGPNVLAHAFQPGTEAIFGPGGTIAGDMHFDDSNIWSDGGGGGTIDFHTVALHELGHALGLGHSAVAGSVMEATYAGPRRALHADDIAGITAIYGALPVTAVPEPGTVLLLGIGVFGMFGYGLLRRKQVQNLKS
ncbi:metalloproteinase [Candidatus Scalindua japonica]|uniref:Metalloproteinase n=2 Tax=Candidatus Scalindua japonica TaxID=1284222 RepID=A0A286TVW2_9BACT|nr:metalloproteinase [Candidatus Scalindua japonica]